MPIRLTRGTGRALLSRPTAAAAVAPDIVTTSLANATYGVAYSADITVSGSPAPTLSVTSGALPTGLSLSQVNDTTWRISGTPTFSGTPGATSENASFTITATNAGGSDPQAYTLTLNHTLNTYIAALSPILWYRFDETSGAVVNYGSLGSTGNGTVAGTGITQGASGITTTGSTETGRVEVANNAAFNALQDVTWIFRGTFTGAGNGSVARLFQLGSANYRLNQGGSNILSFVVQRASGNETLNSSINMTNYSGTPILVFATASATSGLALWRGLSNTVTAFGTANSQTGAISTQTGQLALLNEHANPFTRQHPGTTNLFVCIGSVISSTQRNSITTLAGV